MPSIIEDTVIGRLDAILAEVNGQAKQASELPMSGDGASDPGGYCGPSTHPSKDVHTTQRAPVLGARGKENEADVKKQHPGAGTDSVQAGGGGSQDSKQINIGTNQSAVGEDPKVEDDYRDNLPDPGGYTGDTSHPANLDDVHNKYSSERYDLPTLYKMAGEKMNAALAMLAAYLQPGQAQQVPDDTTKAAAAAPAAPDAAAAAQAGYELADQLVDGWQAAGIDKEAAVREFVARTIYEASTDADNVANELNKIAAIKLAELQKRANPMAAAEMAAIGGGATADDVPPPPGGPMGAMGGPGMPPPGPMPGEAGETGESPGMESAEHAGGPGGPGAGNDEHGEALNELFNALVELGIPPEEILALAQQAASGGPDAKMASTLLPRQQKMLSAFRKDASTATQLSNLCGATIQRRDAGKCQLKQATGKERVERDEIKAFVLEACGLSGR